MTEPVASVVLAGIPLFKKGKVREVYEIDGRLLIVASDRISAFDWVLPTLIPRKGEVLTKLSAFWFRLTRHIVPNHFLTDDVAEYPAGLEPYRAVLAGRSMLVEKTEPLSIECVVRGYISGSGWEEYRKTGEIAGRKFSGLKQGDKLPEPLFTPAIKAESGHDENISFERMVDIVGRERAETKRKVSLELYKFCHAYALQRGIIIADTKFEFGIRDGRIMLIDEIFTPDSSRFWELKLYQPGGEQASYDKQFVRNYLLSAAWDRNSPPPELPPDIVEKTVARYLEALSRLSG
jgi:phosphoribosylaminoimidazole-succinocarboxamide synthase